MAGLVLVHVEAPVEVLVEPGHEAFSSAQEVDHPRGIVHGPEEVGPRAALGEAGGGIGPPGPVGGARSEHARRGVEQVAIAPRPLHQHLRVPGLELPRHASRAIVVDPELDRARHRLVGLVVGNVAEPQVVSEAAAGLEADPVGGRGGAEPGRPVRPASCGVLGRWDHRVLADRRVGLLHVVAAQALHERVRDHAVRVRGDHDVGLRRVGPEGEPSPLCVHLDESFHHVVRPLGSHQREQRVLGAEGVPQREIVVGDAIVHPIVERAVIPAALREEPGVEQGVEERGVERPALLGGAALHVDAVQEGVPGGRALGGEGVQVPARDLPSQVGPRLIEADERGADLHQDLAGVLGEGHVAAHVQPAHRTLARSEPVALPAPDVRREGPVELDHEVTREVGERGAEGVRLPIRVPAYDLALVAAHLGGARNARTGRVLEVAALDGLEDEEGWGARREGEPHEGGVLARRHLRHDPAGVGLHLHAIALGSRGLVGVAKREALA